jgi:alpha-N-arabinofuranosidase
VAVFDAVITVDESGRNWALALVNRHPSSRLSCTITMNNTPLEGTYDATVLTGESPDAYNDLAHPLRVTPQRARLRFRKGTVDLPPHSLTIVAVTNI